MISRLLFVPNSLLLLLLSLLSLPMTRGVAQEDVWMIDAFELAQPAQANFADAHSPETPPPPALPTPFVAAAVPDAPSLWITNVSGQFVVSWPAAAGDWVLEQSGQSLPTAWNRVSPSLYQMDGARRSVVLAAVEGARFYRLRRLPPAIPGMSGSWSMDEGIGSIAEDGSAIGRQLFLSKVGWAPGRVGPGALRFNGGAATGEGSRSWVSNANYQVLPRSGQPFSVSFWLNPDSLTPGWRALAGNAVAGSNGWSLALQTIGPGTNYLIFAGVGAGSSLSVTGRTLLLPGQWRQLTATYDGAQGSLYLDAAPLGQSTGTLLTHEGPIYFGGGVAGYDSFLGRLDEIRTHTNHLTYEQISLRGDWRFEEAGAFVTDRGLEGQHASLLGSPTRVPGRNGLGIDLAVSQVSIPNPDLLVLPESGCAFSISFWLWPDVLAPGRTRLLKSGAGTNDGWELTLEVQPAGEAQLRLDAKSLGGTLDLRTPVLLTEGVWTKLDLTYNGGMATLYLDGREVHAQSGAILASRGPLVIGAGAGAPFAGVLDELKIYSRERSSSEIGPHAQVMWEAVHLAGSTNLVLQGSGPAGRPLIYTLVPVVTPTNGFVAQAAPGSAQVTFHAGDRKGPDAFAYTVSDGEFTSEPAVVVMSVVQPHWLSPQGGVSGTLDGRTPAGAWVAGPTDALDAIWRTNNYYDCFYYAPGVYETRGWKSGERSTAAPGCKHVGSGTAGATRTTLRLVDLREPFVEEMIFAHASWPERTDNFEVHHLVLDCNAANLPKFSPGRPEWIRIPLATAARVDSVTFHWTGEAVQPGRWVVAHADRLTLTARKAGAETFVTNYVTPNLEGEPDLVPVGAEADELFVQLTRRGWGVDYYSLREVEVAGAEVSVAEATIPGGGESRLGASFSILEAVDGDPSTAWASGPEGQVRIVLPLAPGTAISQVALRWNCRTLDQVGRLGPAVAYGIQVRDEATGSLQDVPLVRHGRAASGWETNTFGTVEATNVVVTDRLVLHLTAREPGVDFYSLRELTLQEHGVAVPLRLPTALSQLNYAGNHSPLKAFDRDPSTWWACGPQGAASAIAVSGSNLKLTHLQIVGFGTRAGRECFPLYLTHLRRGGTPDYLGNVLVEDCVISDPAPGNTDGLTAINMAPVPPNRLTNAVLRRCTVKGVKGSFTYSHGASASWVEQCLVEDCEIGVYFEPERANVDDIGPVLIRSNRFVNVTSGVYLQYHASSYFDSVTCLHNEIVLDQYEGFGMASCDICSVGPAGSLTNLTFLNNIVRYPDWVPRAPARGGGLLYSDIQHAVYGNNLVALDPTRALRVRDCPSGFIPPDPLPEDCDHPRVGVPGQFTRPPCVDTLLPGYRRGWFNNRNLSGELLPVRFSNLGTDGPASQQQWRE